MARRAVRATSGSATGGRTNAPRAPASTAGAPTDSVVSVDALTLASAPLLPQESATSRAASSAFQEPAMAPRYLAPSDAMAFPDPLPSLTAMMTQNRLNADHAAGNANTTATGLPPRSFFEPFNTLASCDWDALLGTSEPAEGYVSPDILPLLNGNGALQGSAELETNGREFLSSPPIPAFGAMSDVSGNLLVPARLLVPRPPHQGSERAVTKRYELRAKLHPAPTLPSFETICGQVRGPSVPIRPLPAKWKSGRSTRTRLFGSPSGNDDKENQPTQTSLQGVRPSLTCHVYSKPAAALTGRAAKKPLGSNRRSLDSAASPLELAPPPERTVAQTVRRSKDCAVPGCGKGARSKGLCKRHGGGKRCSHGDCTRSDQGGGFCIAHGGGKRCSTIGCSNAAQSRGLCKSHGGGKRCSASDCNRSAQGGGFCRRHGGAKLCKASVCFNYRHHKGLCRAHSTPKAQE